MSNDGWEHATSDLCTIHDYSQADGLRDRFASVATALAPTGGPPVYAPGHHHAGQPILVTEFGGILTGNAVDRIGYAVANDADQLLSMYDAMVSALVESHVVAGFCYTQLTDVEQEINGLLTPDRKPKADLSRIRSITTQR